MTSLTSRYLPYLFALTKTAIFIAVSLIVIHFFVATIFIVEGASMLPNLEGGQMVLVNRFWYLLREPKRGEIVVLRYPGDPDKRIFVKRVIALPEEKVVVKEGRVLVDGQVLVESYLAPTLPTAQEQEVIVPAHEYYTLGDNRPISNDSRTFGSTPRRFLVGKVIAVLLPLNQFKIFARVFY